MIVLSILTGIFILLVFPYIGPIIVHMLMHLIGHVIEHRSPEAVGLVLGFCLMFLCALPFVFLLARQWYLAGDACVVLLILSALFGTFHKGHD